ncbi:hypothetical protein Tco_0295195 [Tanacetum coccineum]
MNANLFALVVVAQHYPDTYYQAPKPNKTDTSSSRQKTSTRSHATTWNKGKEIVKPITPPSESASKEDIKDYAYHKEKMMLCKQAAKDVPLSAELDEWLHDTDEEPDKQELAAHYIQHFEKPESINDTYVVEKVDRNVIPDSLKIFANLEYLKKAQWEKQCLYNVKYDKNDLANIFAPESDETIRLAEESRSKLGDLVKPYDYKKLKSREQLYFSNDSKKNIFKTSFKKRTTNLVKNIEYLPKHNSIRKSKYVIQDVKANVKNIKGIVDTD